LSEQLGHPHTRAWVALCRGASAFFVGDWEKAQTACATADAAFQRHAGALFEIATARVFFVWSSAMRGQLREALHPIPRYVEEAENRGDLYSATYHMTGFGNAAWLIQDDPAEARRMLALVEQRWPNEDFHVPRFLNIQAAVNIELYEGRGVAAHRRVLRDWAFFRWGVPFRTQMTRFALRYARGLSALAAYDATGERLLLHEAESCARAIARERVEYAAYFSDMLLAAAATRRGKDETALGYLVLAEQKATRQAMPMHAAGARHRRGELVLGDEGRALIDAGRSFLANQGVKRPEQLLALVTPPLWRSRSA
jgi:hypothetical protein